MAPDYEAVFSERSEHSGTRGPQYLAPDGTPRRLGVGEQAGLMRRAGIADQATSNGTDPDEFGILIRR